MDRIPLLLRSRAVTRRSQTNHGYRRRALGQGASPRRPAVISDLMGSPDDPAPCPGSILPRHVFIKHICIRYATARMGFCPLHRLESWTISHKKNTDIALSNIRSCDPRIMIVPHHSPRASCGDPTISPSHEIMGALCILCMNTTLCHFRAPHGARRGACAPYLLDRGAHPSRHPRPGHQGRAQDDPMQIQPGRGAHDPREAQYMPE